MWDAHLVSEKERIANGGGIRNDCPVIVSRASN